MDTNKINNVLYVDDEPINLELFEITFRKSFNVLLADSGFSALSMLDQNKDIRIVISDFKMPHMSGLEFIRKAREIDTSLVFFLLSGYSISDEVIDSVNTGLVKKYFHKPFDKDDIIRAFKPLLDTLPTD